MQAPLSLTGAMADGEAPRLLRAAQALMGAETPQAMVEVLREHVLDVRVTTCILLLYGGDTESAAPGQRAYLAMQGTWSRRMGSGVAAGIRLYLTNYTDLIARLDVERLVLFDHPSEIRDQFDPLVSGFFHTERVRSVTLMALRRQNTPIGVLLLAADRPHAFTPEALARYRQVSDFLALNLHERLLRGHQDQLQQQHDAVIDAVRDGVVMVLPFDKGGRVMIANRSFRRLFEIDEADQVNKGDSLIELLNQMRIAETTRQELRATWLSVPPRAPAVLNGEFRFINREGRPMDIGWYSAPVFRGRQVMGRIYTFHDLSHERAAQQLRAAFLSRLSHELRTPLTSIRGFAEFILEVSGDQLPALAREYTEIILNSARHLNTLFTDLIEITRAEAGELKLTRTEANMTDLVIMVVARLELDYRRRGQQVVMELDDDLPLVSVDVDRIGQVLTNLVGNAIKYAPEHSEIHINTELIDRPEALTDGAPAGVVLPAVLVTVRDQGKGLTHDEAAQVFMPFFRTEEARRARIEGAGLGLAVARSIIEIHRGKIWATPRGRAQGGCFQFTIPL